VQYRWGVLLGCSGQLRQSLCRTFSRTPVDAMGCARMKLCQGCKLHRQAIKIVPLYPSTTLKVLHICMPRRPSSRASPFAPRLPPFTAEAVVLDCSWTRRVSGAPFKRSLELFLSPGSLVSSLTPMCRVVNDNIHRQGNSAYVTAPAAKYKFLGGSLDSPTRAAAR